jgi:hypothetical protein
MRTYLFDIINQYKRFSEELDAKTIICNKAWWVFNDSGEKEVYIFNTDGTLIISVSGKVTNATWQYIAANHSLIISGNNQSYMVHPAFYDQVIFALQLDGTDDCAFLIDENNLPSIPMRTFEDVKNYFAEKERQALLEEERKIQAEATALMQQQLEAEREKQRLEEEAKDAEAKKRAEEIDDEIRNSQTIKMVIPIFIYIGVILCLIVLGLNEVVVAYIASVGMIAIVVNAGFQISFIDSKIEKWKKEHPDDPACKYL